MIGCIRQLHLKNETPDIYVTTIIVTGVPTPLLIKVCRRYQGCRRWLPLSSI